jgi:hypothetical protein
MRRQAEPLLAATGAGEERIETFSALLLTENTEMLDLLRRLGSTRVIEREGSCIEERRSCRRQESIRASASFCAAQRIPPRG